MRSKIVIALLTALLLGASALVLVNWLPHRFELARHQRIHRNWDREYSRLEAHDAHPELLRHFRETHYPDETARIDAVRSLIHTFSINRDATGIEKHGDIVTSMLAELLENPEAEKPHLLCDHQANIMIMLLDALDIEARLVHAFSTRGAPALHDHSFLEVRNPDTGAWEIQDPYDNVYWKDLKTGNRVGLLPMVLNAPERYVPCREGVCDRSLSQISRKRKDFFQAMVYDYSRDRKRSVCIVNSRRFDMDTVFDEARIDNATFDEFLERWIDPIVIVQ